MSLEEIDTESSASSFSEVSSLNDEFDTTLIDFDNSDEEITAEDNDDSMNSYTWNEIEPESDTEFSEDHGLIEDVTSTLEDNTINPIDCYRHFITDEIIDLMVRETNRYAQQYMESHAISRRSMFQRWKPTTDTEMFKFFGIIIEMGLVRMPKLKYYWSSSPLYGSQIIQNTMSRERFESLLKFWHFSNNNDKNSNQDRLFKLKPLLDLLKERFSSVYIPGSIISIDESMIPWRGRLLFKQYIPWKSTQVRCKDVQISSD